MSVAQIVDASFPTWPFQGSFRDVEADERVELARNGIHAPVPDEEPRAAAD